MTITKVYPLPLNMFPTPDRQKDVVMAMYKWHGDNLYIDRSESRAKVRRKKIKKNYTEPGKSIDDEYLETEDQ
jgi:hypothetical protein